MTKEKQTDKPKAEDWEEIDRDIIVDDVTMNYDWIKDIDNEIENLIAEISFSGKPNWGILREWQKKYNILMSEASYLCGLAESQFPNHPKIKDFKSKFLNIKP